MIVEKVKASLAGAFNVEESCTSNSIFVSPIKHTLDPRLNLPASRSCGRISASDCGPIGKIPFVTFS